MRQRTSMLGRQFDDTYVFVFRNLSLSRSHQEDSNEKGYAWILPSTKIWMNWVEKWGDLMVKTGNISFTSPTLQVRLFPIYIHCWNKSYSYFFRPEVTACGLRCGKLYIIYSRYARCSGKRHPESWWKREPPTEQPSKKGSQTLASCGFREF